MFKPLYFVINLHTFGWKMSITDLGATNSVRKRQSTIGKPSILPTFVRAADGMLFRISK